ncbi:Cell division protein FtsL [Candidatus Glomeribacter gigasporarum BEG34]|uniref:Cell division protein FtsL n=1 Tax=Candidatus Glomeribacter gigasporarum BEG34 TaxID=1070319 RepID=G2J910_9BURK|nr:cell division protein FtsL [Candidatus Glomeribacter gigasporarum]CCD29257.1 Cell division protein FtsL [Candidatus Glomeribacter gigasporarum BEG34]
MSRLNIVLLVALIGCALSVVHTAYQQRRLFIALERARAQQQQLQQEGAQLYYQQRALSKTARIERLATHRLNMVPVTNVVTQYLGVSKRSNAVQAAEECSKTVAAFCGGMQ